MRNPCHAAPFLKDVRGDSGFTLVEVLVALGIFSAALIILLAAFSQLLARVSDESTRYAARILARQLLAEEQISSPSGSSRRMGKVGGLFWSVVARPYAVDSSQDGGAIVDVTVTVSPQAQGTSSPMVLHTLRLISLGGQ